MSKLEQPLPSASPSRELEARREVGQTDVSLATVRVLVAGFLAVIVSMPVVEIGGARARRARGEETAWSHLAQMPREIEAQLSALSTRQAASLWDRLIAANRAVLAGLSAFERALEQESTAGHALRPPAQSVMTGWLGAGNERVYLGAHPWLFYRPDVAYVTGRPFLDPAERERRIGAASEWETPPQPDPREAIVQFKRDLDALGVALIVFPTPGKPVVHPEHLAAAYGRDRGPQRMLQNPSYDAFVDSLRAEGILVFDSSQLLSSARAHQFLATDTHWRPEAMEAVAEQLARLIQAEVELPEIADPQYQLAQAARQNTGDIALMLDLPDTAALYPAETVWLRRVLRPDDSLWRSSRDADVLVLGDSFSNIYSLESMGWGTSAGFVEHLSFTLKRPVDRLTQNDQGAFATRAMLQRDPRRLDGKRVVVWQFAVRELSFGDWKILPVR
jgi:alginate O-acetyltransferase complex protein AlgJ